MSAHAPSQAPALGSPRPVPEAQVSPRQQRDEVINQGRQMDRAKFFERKLKDTVLLKIDISMR